LPLPPSLLVPSLADSSFPAIQALELPRKLPDEKVLARWLGEPVRAVIISTKNFLTNETGYPVLSKPHQAFLHRLMRVRSSFFFVLLFARVT